MVKNHQEVKQMNINKQNSKYKKIIEDMVDEYQNQPTPRISKLYHIIAGYLDEESEAEINSRLQNIDGD